MNMAASTLQAILLEKKNHIYHHLKLLNVVLYEMTTMLFMNLIGRMILNIWNDEKDAGNNKASELYKFGPTSSTSVSSKGQLISNFCTAMEDVCTLLSAPSNNSLNSYRLSASITRLAKILKQG
jgi:hypothetical protein